MAIVWIIAGVVVLVVLYAWYATIVTRRNRVDEALGSVDVQLTQRHDLVPNLLAIAKRFMAHEAALLNDITVARAQAQSTTSARVPAEVAARFEAENRLEAGLGRLFAVAEAYPDLKSDGPMIEAQRAMQEAETNVAAARRFYNTAVGDLRNAVQIFPGVLLAGMAGVGTLPPFYVARAEERIAIDAAAHL